MGNLVSTGTVPLPEIPTGKHSCDLSPAVHTHHYVSFLGYHRTRPQANAQAAPTSTNPLEPCQPLIRNLLDCLDMLNDHPDKRYHEKCKIYVHAVTECASAFVP